MLARFFSASVRPILLRLKYGEMPRFPCEPMRRSLNEMRGIWRGRVMFDSRCEFA